MSKTVLASTVSRAGLLLGVSLGAMVFTTPALAQATEDTATEETVPPGTAPAEADAQLEAQSVADTQSEAPAQDDAIVVTGSRIRRTEATSAAPLQIIDPTIGMRQGQSTTAELIQSSPLAAGSTQISAAISTNFITNGGPGSQTISLRGLGAERTLVLLNSKRAGPAGTRGGVASFDLNVLPSSIIKSVEILKDGASSIYGSDAIAGVVNILTKRETDGIELTGSASVPLKNGGEQYDISATWGKDFGRGHILLSGSYYRQNLLRKADRSFLGCGADRVFRNEHSDESVDVIDPRTNRSACVNGVTWGHVWTYFAYNLPDFGDGVLLQPDFGQNLAGFGLNGIPPATGYGDLHAPPGYFPVAYDQFTAPWNQTALAYALTNSYSGFEQKATVIPETTRKTFYADGSFDVTDNIELYGEFLFNNRKTFTDSLTQIYNFGPANFEPTPGEPFPGFYNDPEGGFVYLSPTNIVDQYDNTIDVDYYRGVAGLRGDIGSNWRWDIYGQYSRSVGKYTYNQIIEDALYTQWYKYGTCEGPVLNPDVHPEGSVTPISGKQCIDINWVSPEFLAGNLTPEELDFLIGEETGKTIYTQKYVEGTIAGDLINLPAGPLGVAVGAVYRRDSINDRPGDITMAPNPLYDPTIPLGSAACLDDRSTQQIEERCAEFVDNAYANPVSSGHTRGHSETTEAFGEVNIPIFRNAPFARSLDISAAARVTNVKAVRASDGFTDNNKGNWTYKVQGNWQVTDWLRLRSTYGTSFRAPALFEQFLAGQVTGARQNIDPCVNWQAGLNANTITPRIAANCQADQTFNGGPAAGIGPTHDGGGIQIKVFNSGGIGNLDPETSRSFTASAIFTPRLAFLPDTDIAFTVDYFDIKVKGEITQLGAANILRSCYDAEDFPTNPLCGLFRRGQIGDPELIIDIQDSFINVNRQSNRGIDFTLRANHRFGGDTRFSLLANATYQLHDDITLFGGDIDDLNGEIGDPKFTADVNLNLDKGPWSFFWGVDFVGKTSNEKQFIEDNGGICFDSADDPNDPLVAIYGGQYCYDVTTEAKFYHSASITRRIADDRYQITMGISNLFDTKPPFISPAAVFGDIGQVPGLGSQYDWLGRRFFVNVRARF